MSLQAFCAAEIVRNGTQSDEDLIRLKSVFKIIMLTICIIGVIGNILNLITLRSPTLKTVPFIYIRALAIFDLVGLSAIIMHFIIQSYDFASVFLVYYEVWIEDVLINSLLVAGLYTALLLTLERYLLIRKPHKQRLFNIQNSVVLKIVGVLFISILLHSPMALQNTAKLNAAGKIIKGNNQQLLCREPYWSIFNYYKMAREFLRFLAVSLLVILNSIITKSLQIAKKNRRLLIKRSSATDCNDVTPMPMKDKSRQVFTEKSPKKDNAILMKSFTERKLTALMITICIIYVIGNVPQMLVMLLQNEKMNKIYSFQVFRNVANTLEVLLHAVNFFMYCATSSEYTRAFLLNCRCLSLLLLKFPACASFIHARRLTNSNLSAIDQRDLPPGYSVESNRRKSSLFYDLPERKNTICMQITSSSSDLKSIASIRQSLTPFDECIIVRNPATVTLMPDLENSGDEYL